MQITFNSYEEMMDFMEKIQGRVSAKEEKAVITAEEMKQHSVSESCQSIPVSAPAQNVPPVSTPVAPTAPVQTAVPTSRHEYTRDDLARAAMTLMDKGGMVQLQQLLTSMDVRRYSNLRRISSVVSRHHFGDGGADLMGHEERDHALLSASSAHRWLKCTKSARLEEQFPDTTSEAAKEGTLAHELAELKVRNYFKPGDVSKRKLTFAIKKFKEDPLWDDEMLIHTDTYIDYIRDVSIKLPATPFVEVEKRVDFSDYVPEGFGTADCIMIQGNTLFVIDFKYGKGVPVSAEENPQMMLYALGAYEACKILYPMSGFA